MRLIENVRARQLRTAGLHLAAGIFLIAPSVALAQNGGGDTGSNSQNTQEQASADESATLKAVLGEVKSVTSKARGELKAREAKFEKRLADSKQKLANANAKQNRLENEGSALETSFDAKKIELDEKTQLLKDKIGALKELFGVFQQNASCLLYTSPSPRDQRGSRMPSSA